MGQAQAVLTELETKMLGHADQLEFEQAAELRNQMSALSQGAAPAVHGNRLATRTSTSWR